MFTKAIIAFTILVAVKAICRLNFETVHNMDIDRFMGKWYEYGRTQSVSKAYGSCMQGEYVKINKLSFNYTFNGYDNEEQPMTVTGTTLLDPVHPKNGKMFSTNIMVIFYWVIDTDYDSYSILYTCNLNPARNNTYEIQVFTREPYPKQELVDKIQKIIEDKGFKNDKLTDIGMSTCPKNTE